MQRCEENFFAPFSYPQLLGVGVEVGKGVLVGSDVGGTGVLLGTGEGVLLGIVVGVTVGV